MSKASSHHLEFLETGDIHKLHHAQHSFKPTSVEYATHPALEKRVIRKTDLLVIPLICITYLITYIDKAMLGYSAVFGLKESLYLRGTEYSWLGMPSQCMNEFPSLADAMYKKCFLFWLSRRTFCPPLMTKVPY